VNELSQKVTDKEFWVDNLLKSNLDSIAHNLKRDWDFIGIISGDGLTRVGKSVLAQQVAYYVSYNLGRSFDMNNICFTSEDLIKKAVQSENSCFIYDESRESLDAKKAMGLISRGLFDFFAECGKLNHFIILVLPDFFDLNRRIAVNRSAFLINVFRTTKIKELKSGAVSEYQRGHYAWFGRNKKKRLFILGKKNFDDYHIVKPDFYGKFDNKWMVNEAEYDKVKMEFIRRDRNQIKVTKRTESWLRQRNGLVKHLHTEFNYTQKQICDILKRNGHPIARQAISAILKEDNERLVVI